jgi:hypothetical protein
VSERSFGVFAIAPGDADEDPSGGFAHGGWHMRYMEDELAQRWVLESSSIPRWLANRFRLHQLVARQEETAFNSDVFLNTGPVNHILRSAVARFMVRYWSANPGSRSARAPVEDRCRTTARTRRCRSMSPRGTQTFRMTVRVRARSMWPWCRRTKATWRDCCRRT